MQGAAGEGHDGDLFLAVPWPCGARPERAVDILPASLQCRAFRWQALQALHYSLQEMSAIELSRPSLRPQ